MAAYSFNEGSGTTVTDASGHNNTGTISGATWTTAGKFGGALVFNGTSAQVTIPDAPSLRLTTDMTLEAWVKPSKVTSAWRDVIYKGNDNYYLEATSTNNSRPAGGAVWWTVYRDVWDSGLGGEHVDAPGRDLRRGDPAPVCQRSAGLQPGPDREPGDLHEPVADRWGQHLRAVLPGDHR